MQLRPFNLDDVDACVELYVTALNAVASREEWNLKAAEERLQGILESPVFAGWVATEGEQIVGMALGVYAYWVGGKGYELLEIFCEPKADRKALAQEILLALQPLLIAAQVDRMSVLTNELWRPDFFGRCGFEDVPTVRLYRKELK